MLCLFLWSIWKTIDVLLRTSSMDYLLFENVGYTWLFYVLAIALLIALLGGFTFLITPKIRIFYVTSQIAVVLNLLFTAMSSILAMRFPEQAQNAYTASREARGLSVHQATLDMMTNPVSHTIVLIVATGFAILWLLLLNKIKNNPAFIKEIDDDSIDLD